MPYPMIQWDAEKVAAFWDYECQFQSKYFTATVAPALVKFLRGYLPPGATILDFGCGVGILAEVLLDSGCRVAATDFSKESVEIVNNKLKDRSNFEGAVHHDDMKKLDRTYDAVTVTEVIEHLDDAALDTLVTNVSSFMSEGGLAMFTTPNDEDLPDAMVFCPGCRHVFHRRQHIRSWNSDSLSAYMKGHGLTPVFVDGLDLESVVSRRPAESALRYFNRWLKGRMRWTRYWRGRRKRPHLVCVVRKSGK